MSTSGTTSFNPSLGSLTIYAFQMIGVRPTELLQEHMDTARMAANMLCSRWSADGVNLWRVELVTQPVTQGVSTYDVDPNVVNILDAYMRTTNGSVTTDRIIMPISRSEWASYPNKQQQGFPTVFWFDRLLSPTLTIWPVPDGNQTSVNYYALIQIEDAVLQGAKQVDIPYYFQEAFAFGLAARLAAIWAPDRAAAMKAMADESYAIAAAQNIENASFYVSPQIGGYFSR